MLRTENFSAIAEILIEKHAFFGGFEIDCDTHFDILFTINPLTLACQHPYRNFQFGIQPHNSLFVSIMRLGSFAFSVKARDKIYSHYITEKLGIDNKLTANNTGELICNVINEIINLRDNRD